VNSDAETASIHTTGSMSVDKDHIVDDVNIDQSTVMHVHNKPIEPIDAPSDEDIEESINLEVNVDVPCD